MTARYLSWTATAVAGQTLPVLDGQITVDSTRCPQVSASLTLPHTSYPVTKGFDPFTRSPVFLEMRQTNFVGGTLSTFAKPAPGVAPQQLSALDWSNKASKPQSLDGSVPRVHTRTLKLYVTDVTVNESGGTFDVQLASADHLLTELVNYGKDWYPPIFTTSGDVTYHYLNMVWDAFFEQFALPLTTDFNGGVFRGLITNADPWRTGETAWSYLDKLRTQATLRYALSTTTGLVSFPFGGPPPYVAIDRSAETSVSAKRSVENSFDGVNQYADGVLVRWTDDTDADRPDAWDSAYLPADWRKVRRTSVQERAMLAAGPVPLVASQRLERMSRFRRVTTVTIPHDPLAAPFRDLTEHPNAESVQSIVYDYSSGDITTTYLEAD